MLTLEAWVARNGAQIAELLENQREPICARVSQLLEEAFPTLCYDPTRQDALSFQQQAFRQTPIRFHTLLQVLLKFQTFQVIKQEYTWGWPIMQRYGIERRHLYALVQWYFDAARSHVHFKLEDSAPLSELTATVMRNIQEATQDSPPFPFSQPIHTNGVHP